MNSEVFIADADGSNQKEPDQRLVVRGLAGLVARRKHHRVCRQVGNAGWQIFLMGADGIQRPLAGRD